MTVFLGTLWSPITQVKGPYMFDGEHGIALYEMQENRASSHGEGEISCFFSSCGWTLWYILKLQQGWPSKLVFVQQRQDSCLVMRDTSRISSRLDRAIGTLLRVRRETQCPFPVATGIPGFLSIFKRSQASSPFLIIYFICLFLISWRLIILQYCSGFCHTLT